MTRWFRMYDEILDDPKVQKLPAEDFKAWVNLLCLASKNEGKLPNLAAIAFALRMSENDAQTLLERLSNAPPNGGANDGLIDRRNGGADGYHYAIHGWTKRQYKSDGSTERVKRFRQRSRNDDETLRETGPEPEPESEQNRAPQPPADGGPGSGRIGQVLAQELCKRTGIGNAGPASIAHVERWLADGISVSTIRAVVGEMASKAGATRSLKRFDQPIRRAHAERKPTTNGQTYVPRTVDELERALRCAEENGWADQAARWRQALGAMKPAAAGVR